MRLARFLAPILLLLTLLAPAIGLAGAANAAGLPAVGSMPAIRLAPNAVFTGAANHLTVTGSGFAPQGLITLRLDQTTPLGAVRADAAGAFSVAVTIPSLALGKHVISAGGPAWCYENPAGHAVCLQQNGRQKAAQARVSAAIYAVAIQLSTTTAPAGARVTISGQGFLPSQPLTVLIGGQSVLTTSTDASGAFANQSFVAPSALIGAQQLQVRSGSATPLVVATVFTIGHATLTVSPGTVQAGRPISVSGAGYTPRAILTIKLGNDTLGSVTTGATGAFGPDHFTVPVSISAGQQSLSASGPSGQTVATASLVVNKLPLTLVITPTTGIAGARVSVTGSGFQAGESVVLSIANHALATTVANSAGQIALTLTLPRDLAAGNAVIQASGQTSRLSATVVYAIPSATLSLSATSAIPGTRVMVSGHDFAAGERVTIDLGQSAVTTVVADGAGNFSLTLTIPVGQPAGSLTISAVGQSSRQAPRIALSVVSGARIALSTGTVQPGGTVAVSGTGFDPGEVVVLTLPGLQVATARADAHGSFALAVTIPATVAPATLQFTASGRQSGRTVSATLHVVAAPVRVVLSSASIRMGGSLQVSGSGFLPGEQVAIAVSGQVLRTVTADGHGAFANVAITLPANVGLGADTLTVTGTRSHRIARASLNVTARLAPQLRVTPSAFTAGTQVRIMGSGFAPGEKVSLAIAGGPQFATALTGRYGRFVLTVTLPATLAAGTVTITATGSTSHAATQVSVRILLPSPVRATSTTWYFAAGRTNDGFSERIAVLNPNGSPVSGAITFFYNGNQTRISHFTLAAHARGTYKVDGILGVSTGVSAVVQANLPIAAARVTERGGKDIMSTSGVSAPARTWYMAEGYTSLTFKEYLHLLNPGTTFAHVRIVWPQFNGQASNSYNVTLAPRSRVTINVNAHVYHASHATVVTSDQPIVAATSIMFGARGQGADSKAGMTHAATTLYFAEGSTNNGFEEYITILNPDQTRQASVTASFYGSNGQLLGRRVVRVGPMHRGNIKVNNVVRATAISTVLQSNIPIVAERSMYFGAPNGGTAGGTVVFGRATPALGWAFATGNTTPGYAEFELLFNPNRSSSTIQATYYGAGGQMIVKTYVLHGHTRMNIDVTRMLPGLASGYHGVILRSLNGVSFVAEQAIYDNHIGNGGATIGTPLS